MEKPPIIDERLREVGRGAASKIARRMGYLKLFTYGSAIGLGAYFALVHEHRHPMTGKPLRAFLTASSVLLENVRFSVWIR